MTIYIEILLPLDIWFELTVKSQFYLTTGEIMSMNDFYLILEQACKVHSNIE